MTQPGPIGPLTQNQFDKLVLLINAAADRVTSARGQSAQDHASAERLYEWHKEQAQLVLVGQTDE